MLRYINPDGIVLTEEVLAHAHLSYFNDRCPLVTIRGGYYEVGNILKAVDPIVFREDFLEYLDVHGWEELDE